MKHDGRRKVRLVAGGHVKDPANEKVYSSVVAPDGVLLLMFMADHNRLDTMSNDIQKCCLAGPNDIQPPV